MAAILSVEFSLTAPLTGVRIPFDETCIRYERVFVGECQGNPEIHYYSGGIGGKKGTVSVCNWSVREGFRIVFSDSNGPCFTHQRTSFVFE